MGKDIENLLKLNGLEILKYHNPESITILRIKNSF